MKVLATPNCSQKMKHGTREWNRLLWVTKLHRSQNPVDKDEGHGRSVSSVAYTNYLETSNRWNDSQMLNYIYHYQVPHYS
jgi:hypothetical protein